MAGIQSNFDFISSYCEPTFNVEKYQSKKTGMKLYHINVPLPSIKLEICVQTKPYDDTGCPHTLEHLIFMGSRKYPQQGYLDYISAQHYSLGTNATTYRDMTTYELTTVNHQSLATLLPVYLDHVFNPLLTHDCYLTEVHHISGETGDDAGVVYSEMQSSENQPDEILLYSILRDLWSDKSPYYYESGGRLESIRNELTLDKIKLFHQKFYVPKNVAIVLCGGGINIDEILQILNNFEQENCFQNENRHKISFDYSLDENLRKKIKSDNDKFPFIKIKRASLDEQSISSEKNIEINPISIDTTKLSVQLTTVDGNDSSFCDSELMVSHGDSSAPSSPSTLWQPIEVDNSIHQRNMNEYKEICYPVEDNDENLGQVAFGYRLESIYEIETYTALDVLLTTLFDEDISIFYKEFIEVPNMLCSSIDHDWLNYPERVLTITFEGVEVDNLTMVADKYSSVLYSIINNPQDNQQLYIQLQRNIKKTIDLHLNEIENEPFSFLTDLCCLDHISELSIPKLNNNENDDEQHLHKFLRNKKYLENLFTQPITYWHELIKKYLLEWNSSKRTIILLKPSNELLIEQQEQDEQRISERLEFLGPNGLKKLKTELDQARANNKQSSSNCANIPHTSTSFDNQLHLPPIEYYSNDNDIDLFHTPTSHFVKYTLHIPLKHLSPDLQLYLPLFSHLLFHTSIQYENIHLDKFNFCERISRDILDCSVTNGQSSSSPIQSSYVYGHYIDTFTISLQSLSNLETYKNTIDYFRYALFGTLFNDYNVILEECEKQLKNLIEAIQDGHTIHQVYFNSLLYSTNSNSYYHQMNIFLQKNLFEKICKQPEKYKKEILSKLEKIKSFILKNLSHMHWSICGNMELIKGNWQIMEQFINESKIKSQIDIENHEIKEVKGKHIPVLSPATIMGSPHEESGYVIRWTRLSISQKDFIPLLIFSNYLDMENGPLWTACRTNGYAYGVAFDFDFEANLILLSINQCSQLKLAYSSAMETLKHLVEQKTNLDVQRLNAARNLTICMLTEHLATLGRATGVCIRSYLNTYSIEKYQDLLKDINSYKCNETVFLEIIEKYLSPLVNHTQSSSLILVNTNKMKETQEFLHKEHEIKNVILIKDVVKHLCR
ncbi:unnamed protein product [Adineta steineri]|uniref:Peptidase M16 N-terminal domain-containing protein n=2 Tax=Adineta steineri TaxID=433720 RepID=A0A814PJ26_9BILA|nr:unnamed protein product [Adineta steineri]CAF3616532.1 unnamed protein product [Adineta steineri]